MVSQATEVRDILFTNWTLTDRLSKVALDNMKEIVRFFDREQVYGNEWPKAIIVRKINDDSDENKTIHPHFTEVRDVYEISCYYRVVDVQEFSYSEALEDVEDMATEAQSILRANFSNPSDGTGTFFVTDYQWRKDDFLDQAQPVLRRTLRYTLTKITSENPGVFQGYEGVLSFGGHVYAETFNVETDYGSPQVAEPITDDTGNLNKIPVYFTNPFNGVFIADMYLDSADISDTEDFGLNTIGDHESNGEVLTATFVQQYTNTVSPTPETITITTELKITRSNVIAFVADLVKFRLTAEVVNYPTMVVA